VDICLARQPIFDGSLKVYAYELLFRRNVAAVESQVTNGDDATTELILNTFSDIGLEQVSGQKLSFINLTRKLVLDLPPLPKESVVLEILEDIEVDPPLIEAVKRLVAQGYTIALDDFVFNESLRPLVELAHIIKIDILALSREQLHEHVALLKKYPVKLLAEKVETHEEFELCQSLGFDYFQGFFLSRPKIVSGRRASTNKIVVMQLLAKLQNPDISVKVIEGLLSEDVRLSYKLLKIVNSAAYGRLRQIESLQQAIVFLGLRKLKEWVSLIAVTSVDNKPHELMITTMVRAKMCETVLLQGKAKQLSDMGFTIGMFSTLDALLDDSMDHLLKEIPLSDDIKCALVGREGILGSTLDNVMAYERADWDQLAQKQVALSSYAEAYLGGIQWAQDMGKALN
jgi:EAL and modified HD-GYP domain-containing signal transduction protein